MAKVVIEVDMPDKAVAEIIANPELFPDGPEKIHIDWETYFEFSDDEESVVAKFVEAY